MIQEGSSLPSCTYFDNEKYPVIRVFRQDTAGYIRGIKHKGPWVADTDAIVEAKKGAPFSAIGWFDTVSHIRIYYMSPNNVMSEYCQDNDGVWFPGSPLPQ